MIDVKIPQIDVPQGSPSSRHKDFMYMLPMSGLYGRHPMRFMDYAARHTFVNKLIQGVYIEHAIFKNIREDDQYYSFDVSHYTQKLNIETIIYWLRKTTDELISLVYCLHYIKKHQQEPLKIIVDCIGKLLNDKSELNTIFADHLGFLTILNDVSNCYKHSFLNCEVDDMIGIKEPTVLGLHIKNNDATKEPIFHNYFLRQIVEGYDKFFQSVKQLLKEMDPYWIH